MAQARIAVSSLEPNQHPEPVDGFDPDEPPEQSGVVSAPNPPMPEERPTAPTIKVGARGRGRPRKVVQPPAAITPSVAEAELQPLYAKVGMLAIYAARAGKDVATFAYELRALLDAYDKLLKAL
jgi:hypothetical protein